MRFGRYISAVCMAVVFVAGAHAQTRTTKAEYIAKYKRFALENQETHGVPASITMAQALLESDAGNSRLAVEANNHFGIKCKSDWEGDSIFHDDDAKGECFRKYASAEASFRDHSDFLDRSPRYAALFELDPLDYKGWARGLKAAGYATNPQYAELLIRTIEDNELYALDTYGLDNSYTPYAGKVRIEDLKDIPRVFVDELLTRDKIDPDNYTVEVAVRGGYAQYINNGTPFVVARVGDTYEGMSDKLKIPARRLRKLNDAGTADQPTIGEPVYVKAKPGKVLAGQLIHTTWKDQTMRSISQYYGIKLKKLLRMNRNSTPDAPLRPGTQVRLG